jgi:hypothetical protein
LKQCCGSGLIESGSRVLMTKIEEKEYHIGTAKKKLSFCLIKNINLLIPRPPKSTYNPRYRRSLQHSKENIHHFKKLNFLTFFCGEFLSSWIQGPH